MIVSETSTDDKKTKEQQRKAAKAATTLARAEALDLEAALSGLTKASLEVNETFADIGKGLITRAEELKAIEGTITLKKEEMKTLHGADKILLTIDELEQERKNIELENVRLRADKQAERDRDDATFLYNRDQARKKENDAWQETLRVRNNAERDRQEAADKDHKVRNDTLVAKEQQYQDALTKLATFDAEVQKAVTTAEKILANVLNKDNAHQTQLTAVQHKATVDGLEKEINHNRVTITSKEVEIVSLKEQLAKAIEAQTVLAGKTVDAANSEKARADALATFGSIQSGNGQRPRS